MRIRKLLAFFLSMSLIVCSVPTFVFADKTEAAEEGANESKVEEVVEAGTDEVIVDGEPAQNGQGGEDGNGDSGDQPIVITPTGDPEITGTPDDPSGYSSGNCGVTAFWTFSGTVLTIKGSGDMFDYDIDSVPWIEYKSKIKTVNISGISYISDYAFLDCINLTSVYIPNSVKTIGNSAFQACSSLTSITIPNSVKTIGKSVFQACSSLTSITIPNSVKTIKADTFTGCSSLTSITIPDSVSTIAASAFKGCSSLTSITIPNSVTTIGNSAFEGCSSLKSILIPNSITTIGASAFKECSSLNSITIPDSVKTIKTATFTGCSSLTSITIPNSVTTIGNYAFDGCSSLKSITIPDSVKSIETGAFRGCSSLTTITIPNIVISVGNIAFKGCNRLEKIYCYSNPAKFNKKAFINIPDNTIIYVDGNYLDAYKKKFGVGYNFVDVSQEIDVLGHRVGLGDQIGIDFFMNIPSSVDVNELSVSFSWGTGNYAKTASGEFVPTTANGANYIASCAIAARCMTDTVTMTIKNGNTVYATSTFKVVDYAAKVAKSYPADNSSGSDYSNLTYNQKLHTLLLAMLDYGAESQKYFKYRTDDLASNYKGTLVDAGSVRSAVNSAYTTYDAATVSSFASKNTIMNIGDDKIGISYAGAAVACTSKTSFKFYFNKADGYDINSLSATYKGKALTFKEEGDSVTLEIAGLSPKEYAPAGTDLYDCSISLTINGKVYTYTYLDYVYKCNNLNHAFKNTAVALAAYSYFAANLEG